MSFQRTSANPRSTDVPNGRNISHRETIAKLTSTSTDFTVYKFVMNPGLSGTFPWLSSQACGYDQYKFKRLAVTSQPGCSTATAGFISMYFDFDPRDGPAPSEITFDNARGRVTGNIWSPHTLNAQTQGLNSRTVYYVRVATPSDTVRRSADTCNLWVALSGVPAGTEVKLEVSYTVQLRFPENIKEPGGTITPPTPSITVPIPPSTPVVGQLPVVQTAANVVELVNAFNGVVRMVAEGTGLTGLTLSAPGLASLTSVDDVINAAATKIIRSYKLSENPQLLPVTANKNMTVTPAGTTLTSFQMMFDKLDPLSWSNMVG
jgi:hypothetical protein